MARFLSHACFVRTTDGGAVAFADRHHGWLAGTEGRILKLVFRN